MLDFSQLSGQMQGFSRHLAQESLASQHRLAQARHLWQQAIPDQAHWQEQQRTWSDRLAFTTGEPLEPLNYRQTIDPAPRRHTVLATDGSQIAPSHHEIAFCYLLNIGRVALAYGDRCYPLLDSVPAVVYEPEDLYEGRAWGIGVEEWMGYRRTVAEMEGLADLVRQWREGVLSDRPTPESPAVPMVALVDGSLIYWFLENLPAPARDRLLPPIFAAWETLRQLRVPVLGYLSASRSGDTLNFLRLLACPHPEPDCDRFCGGKGDRAPCHLLAPLRDTTFWQSILNPGERGPLWRSHSRILKYYDRPIYFCHVHGGSEVARIECPAWVVEDSQLWEQTLSLVLSQIQKGYGYPIALAEAHNQAVVRGGDRRRFFALLERQMIQAGIKNIGVSHKENRKRESIA